MRAKPVDRQLGDLIAVELNIHQVAIADDPTSYRWTRSFFTPACSRNRCMHISVCAANDDWATMIMIGIPFRFGNFMHRRPRSHHVPRLGPAGAISGTHTSCETGAVISGE